MSFSGVPEGNFAHGGTAGAALELGGLAAVLLVVLLTPLIGRWWAKRAARRDASPGEEGRRATADEKQDP